MVVELVVVVGAVRWNRKTTYLETCKCILYILGIKMDIFYLYIVQRGTCVQFNSSPMYD